MHQQCITKQSLQFGQKRHEIAASAGVVQLQFFARFYTIGSHAGHGCDANATSQKYRNAIGIVHGEVIFWRFHQHRIARLQLTVHELGATTTIVFPAHGNGVAGGRKVCATRLPLQIYQRVLAPVG